MAFLFYKLSRYLIVIFSLFTLVQWGLRYKSYTISPKQFKAISANVKGLTPNAASAKVISDLFNAYGGSIDAKNSWIPVTLGSLDLGVYFLHSSVTEYAALIHSSPAQSGRVGFHWSNSTCTVIAGSVSRLNEELNDLEKKETFATGQNFRHGQFESHVYSFGADTVVSCYGRGLIPASYPFIALKSIANGEPLSLFRLTQYYTTQSAQNLLHNAVGFFQKYKNKVSSGEL